MFQFFDALIDYGLNVVLLLVFRGQVLGFELYCTLAFSGSDYDLIFLKKMSFELESFPTAGAAISTLGEALLTRCRARL